MNRSQSPTPSPRGLIRSFTTSSDESAAERIAAARAAREKRRLERERDEALTRPQAPNEIIEEAALPRFELHEADSQDGRSSFGGPDTGSSEGSSLIPKLRVQPTSDRSYTPSVPSTPSKSLPLDSPSFPQVADSILSPPSAGSDIALVLPESPRQSLDNVAIQTSGPESADSVGSPAGTSPASDTTRGQMARPTSPVNVALAGGLMERLKARRAANLAARLSPTAVPATATEHVLESVSLAASEAGSSAAYTPMSEVLPLPVESITPPTSPSQEPEPLDSPSREMEQAQQFQSHTSEPQKTSPSATPYEAATYTSTTGRTVSSKVISRDGDEVEFDFHQLSDVVEQTERSTLSHRRTGSASSAGRPASSTFTAFVPGVTAQAKRFSLTSSVSSFGRQQIDGFFARRRHAGLPQPSNLVVLSAGTRKDSEDDLLLSEASLKLTDATSHLPGREGSSASIFPLSSVSNGFSSSSSIMTTDSCPSDPSGRHPSPTRRVSPELARRAAQFARNDREPSSPTKSSTSRSSSFAAEVPIRRPFPPLAPSSSRTQTSVSGSRSLPQLSTMTSNRSLNEELGRHKLQKDTGAFRGQLAQDQLLRSATASPLTGTVAALSSSRIRNEHWRSADSPPTSFSGGAHARSPSPTGSVILNEGYLFVPPADYRIALDRLDDDRWRRRYCVLTSTGLDFRPTDQEPGARPTRAVSLADCVTVDDDSAEAGLQEKLRPFAVILKGGDRLIFACEKRLERVKWVSALQNAIISATRYRLNSRHAETSPASKPDEDGRQSPPPRTLTPPGSRFSSTRGTVRSWSGQSKRNSELPSSPCGGLGLSAHPAPLTRPLVTRARSISAGSTISSEIGLPEKATADRARYDRDPFGAYAARAQDEAPQVAVARPSSDHSVWTNRALPPLPTRQDVYTDRRKAGHVRTTSEDPKRLSSINNAPSRPTQACPDKKETLEASPVSSSFSKHLDGRSVSTDVSVSLDEVTALERELLELKTAVFSKSKRNERYFRIKERLQAMQRSLTVRSSLSQPPTPVVLATERELAEKVDYLLYLTDSLVKKSQAKGIGARPDEVDVTRVETRIQNLLDELDTPASLAVPSTPSTVRARVNQDNQTVTTRAGIHSPSERFEWQRDLERFKNEADGHADSGAASSVASPNTVLRERERASRKLQNLSPLSPNELEPFRHADSLFGAQFGPGVARSRDPFAGTGVVEPTDSEIRREEPARFASRQTAGSQDGWGGATSSRSAPSWAESDVGKVEQALMRIMEGFERQHGASDEAKYHQERIAQVIGELAKWVSEDRSLREAQFHELVGAVHGVIEHVAKLPQRLLASLTEVEGPASHQAAEAKIGVDVGDLEEGEQTERALGTEPQEDKINSTQIKRPFGINPLSSFAQLERKLAADGDKSRSAVRHKGPRMPGIRLWGAPEPVADRADRWGGVGVAVKASADTHDAEDDSLTDSEAVHDQSKPVVDALTRDEKLGQALQAIADGAGDELSAGAVSLAVFEILQTLRGLSQKQVDQEARERAEREQNSGLTLKEKAELEIKRAEIARLERETALNSERTARINEMVAALASKTDKADELLASIAKDVQEGKTTQMDPALSEEVKKLLGGVRSGVDEHVKDFRGQLTSEVQRIFKEVGKLRDEKKALQAEIAELMAFAAKQGGRATQQVKPAVPSTAAADTAEPPKPGLPSSGFFGPRAMK